MWDVVSRDLIDSVRLPSSQIKHVLTFRMELEEGKAPVSVADDEQSIELAVIPSDENYNIIS